MKGFSLVKNIQIDTNIIQFEWISAKLCPKLVAIFEKVTAILDFQMFTYLDLMNASTIFMPIVMLLMQL